MKKLHVLIPSLVAVSAMPFIWMISCKDKDPQPEPQPEDLPTFNLDNYDTQQILIGDVELTDSQQACRLVVSMDNWQSHSMWPWSEGSFWFYNEEGESITNFDVMKVTIDNVEIDEGDYYSTFPHWIHFDEYSEYLHLEKVTINDNSVIKVDIDFKGVKKIIANFADGT